MADMTSLQEAIRGRGRVIRDGAMLAVERAVQDDCPVGETARLKNSIRAIPTESGDTVGVHIEAGAGLDADYARYQDEGTAAHGPVTAEFLHFKIGGQWIRTKWVRGVPRTGFFTDNVRDWPRYLAEAQ